MTTNQQSTKAAESRCVQLRLGLTNHGDLCEVQTGILSIP